MNERTVVVTGASTGIGEATALHLASRGFRVFAGVRKDADAERLRTAAPEGVEPLRLDVTDESSIAAAASQVAEEVGPAGLAGLVNNAGIAVSGPLEFMPLDELRRQLDVNVVGQVAVTQAFLPQLRAGRGRIVNIGSIGGRIALPLVGPYAASKFAMEGITDSLRREVRQFGIEVSIVEPGGVATPIWDKGGAAASDIMRDMAPEAGELYGDMIATIRSQAAKIGESGLPPIEIAKVIEHALTARRPKTRYLVGRDARMRVAVKRLVGDRRFDALIARTLARASRS
jgi:NAD(P)-dependent dehydrogenase (short-subunit alcohol dehydrogenase family)